MNIGRFSIKHKYFILSIAIAFVFLGIYAKLTLKVQLSPDTNPPMATVMVQYPGASAEDVTKKIVEPMEDGFSTIEGISKIKSTSQDNLAIIQLEFNYGINIDEAAIDAQNSINKIRNKLPENITEPKVLKFSTSDKPIMTIALSSKDLKMNDIRQLAEDKIGYRIKLTEGVAAVTVFGGYKNQVQVEVNRNKIDAYGLALEEISQVLALNNIKAPGGKLLNNNKDILLRIDNGLRSLEEIKNIRIPLKDGNLIYLKDVADVKLTNEELESSYRLKGNEVIAILVNKKSDANTVEVIDNVKRELELLKEKYPFIKFRIAQDDSDFTLQMVNNMTSSLLISIILTVIIIMLFISKINQSLVVSISMPIVFLITLGLMKIFNMKLDLVTLSALILSIGFVVDASIVVVENIMTHHHDFKKDIITAAVDGTSEIAIPSLSGALTTIVVLIPLLFIKGFVGAMFKPLSMTLIFAISASILVALIIIPLFTVLLNILNFSKLEGLIDLFSKPFNSLMDKILGLYLSTLRYSIKNKGKAYLIVLLLMVLSVRFMIQNGIEMLPKFDSGVTFVSIEMKPGTTLKETVNTISIIEKSLEDEENVLSYNTQVGYERDSNIIGDFGVMGTNQALITINLNTRKERTETIWEFQGRLREYIAKIPNIKRYIVKEQGGTAVTGNSAPIDIRLSGKNQEILYNFATDLEEKLKKVEGVTNIYKSFNMDNEQLIIKMNEKRIKELGLNSAYLAKEVFGSVEGISNTSMDINEAKNVDILVKYQNQDIESIDKLLDLRIKTPIGMEVPLRELVFIEKNSVSNIITREDLEYTIDILGYTQGRAFSHIVVDINKIIEEFQLPNGYNAIMTGEQEELKNSMRDMLLSLGLAVIFVYLILVPQFKSFIHPVTVMSAIPLVVIGIAPALGISNKYISMPVLLGFILLAGTVVNNSILLIEYIINIRQRNKSVTIEESILASVKARFRPIMMTALSDVAGMLPLAMQLALGAERFSPLAISVIGGILAATLLTMIIIPLIYLTFEDLKNKLFRNKSKISLES